MRWCSPRKAAAFSSITETLTRNVIRRSTPASYGRANLNTMSRSTAPTSRPTWGQRQPSSRLGRGAVAMTSEERVQAVIDFGFTDRQARFVVLVLRHGAVCVPRQYATFAGIANGG